MESRKTKKNISYQPSNTPKLTKNKFKDRVKGGSNSKNSEKELIESLLSPQKKKPDSKNLDLLLSNKSVSSSNTPKKGNSHKKSYQYKPRQTKSKRDVIINNFHRAISSTNSDDIIVKMLELNEKDIINFYANLEKMIGSELSVQIRNQMSQDIQTNQKKSGNTDFAICPFCCENKSNCVILLCGHMICHKCGKNINRCKYPCPKCKKPIKYIQYIVD